MGHGFGGGGFVGIFLYLLGVFVAILWVLLPFAVFGIKRRLDELIKATNETNLLLARLARVPMDPPRT